MHRPVNAIFVAVFNILLRCGYNGAEPSWSVLEHAKQEYVPWTPLTLALDLELVRVPGVHPLLSILVDCIEEEEVDELKSDVEPEVHNIHSIMNHPIQLTY